LRKRFYWRLPEAELALGETALVIAVIPVSNEFAPDGERYLDADKTYARAVQMEEAGAAAIELVPETLMAGKPVTGEEEQLHRVIPSLKRLKGKLNVPIIVRTSRALVAERAIEQGASAIFDPSGLTSDTGLAKPVSDSRVGLMVGQVRGLPEAWPRQGPMAEPAAMVSRDLRAAYHKATLGNIDKNRLIMDPGLGWGKRKEDNAAIVAQLEKLTRLEAPLAIHTDAPALFGCGPADADAAIIAAVLAGAYLIGAFDVPRALALVQSAEAIAAGQAEPEEIVTGTTRRRY
jgi:dihydropteroate synthase